MSFINYSSREINCKIVYYGPGLCGKTTNLQYIYAKTSPEAKGKMISLATETERTLFFDFLPLSLGEIRGFKTRFHLYTVPGQVFYDASRKLILKGVDGVVFVADSQIERMEANIESLENLRTNLAEQGYNLDKLPYVIQYNKRDLPNAAPVEQLRELLEPDQGPRVRGLRHQRRGVFDTLKAVAKLVLTELKQGRLAASARPPALARPCSPVRVALRHARTCAQDGAAEQGAGGASVERRSQSRSRTSGTKRTSSDAGDAPANSERARDAEGQAGQAPAAGGATPASSAIAAKGSGRAQQQRVAERRGRRRSPGAPR